jgi:hypothetical protein
MRLDDVRSPCELERGRPRFVGRGDTSNSADATTKRIKADPLLGPRASLAVNT